jgi:MFS transporter, ACS family, tartrate transporter
LPASAFFAVLPVFWTLPTAFLSGTGASAGIAAINSIGNLGGFFGPKVFGLLKDYADGDVASLMFLASRRRAKTTGEQTARGLRLSL